MARRSETISPTAHYTGYVWYRHGMSHAALVTPEGRLLFRMLQPMNLLSRLARGPTLEGVLLSRHRAIDQLLGEAIDDGRIGQVIEIAAGLSPRGWDFMKRYGSRIRYIEADLPDMAARKRRLLETAGLMTEGHSVVPLNVLAEDGPQSLQVLAETLDPKQGLAIITEGLLNYFDRAAVVGMWQRFAATLSRFPQGIYWSDLHLADENRGLATRSFAALLSIFVRGRVHMHFNSVDEARDALRDCGFARSELRAPRDVLQAQPRSLLSGAALVRVVEAVGATAIRSL